MARARERRRSEVRDCGVCGGPRLAVLWESWRPTGPLRRHTDVAWRWQCSTCRTKVTVHEPSPA